MIQRYFFYLFLSTFPQIAKAQIINIEDRRIADVNDSTQWYGSLNLGANLSKVEESVVQINSGAQIQRLSGRQLFLLLLDFKFLRAGQQNFNNSGYAHLRYNLELSHNWFLEAYGQVQYNRLLLIRQRSLGGTGLRYQIAKTKNGENRLNIGLSYLYEYNDFTADFASTDWDRLSSYISFFIQPGKHGARFSGTTYFQPVITKWGNYRLSSEWRMSFPVLRKLSFTTYFIYATDTALPFEAPRNTYSWNNGIVWKL